MSKVIAITFREIRLWLHTFSFYFLIAFFLALTGYFFWSSLSYFSLVSFHTATTPAVEVKGLNLTEGVLGLFLANLTVLMLLLLPILTMRSFSEEKKSGTLELLFSYPISNIQIVAGKFLGLLGILFLLVLPTLLYFFLARFVQAHFEVTSLLTGYMGLLLVGASFAALGMFVSALTEHQAVGAGISFAILLFFWVIGWVADWVSPELGRILREFSLVEHFRDMTHGVIDTKDIVFFVLFISFFLFATLCTLEIRNWKR